MFGVELKQKLILCIFIFSFLAHTSDSSEPKRDSVSVKQSGVLDVSKINTSLNSSLLKKVLSNFSLRANLEYVTDFLEDSSISKYKGSSWQLFLTYKLNEDYSIRAFYFGDKKFSQGRDEISNDTRVSLIKKAFNLTENLKYSPSISFVIPTGDNSNLRDKLTTALEINTNLSYSITDALSLSYNPRLRKNFHEYTINRVGTSLTDYSIVHFLFSSYSFTEKLSFNPGVLYSNAWNYNSRKIDDTYLSILDLTYALDKSTNVSIGTRTGGSVSRNEKGEDKTIDILNEASVSYLGLTKTF